MTPNRVILLIFLSLSAAMLYRFQATRALCLPQTQGDMLSKALPFEIMDFLLT